MPGMKNVKTTRADPAPTATTLALTDRQLAKAVLARTVRPKVADVRRLAEAVLGHGEAKKKRKPKKSAGKKAKEAKTDPKLAKIPGQNRKGADA